MLLNGILISQNISFHILLNIFSPRVYSNNNLFIQSEYRQEFKNSNFITDFSYNKKDNSNSHLFATLIGDFEDSFYEMKLETVSNRNYLKNK